MITMPTAMRNFFVRSTARGRLVTLVLAMFLPVFLVGCLSGIEEPRTVQAVEIDAVSSAAPITASVNQTMPNASVAASTPQLQPDLVQQTKATTKTNQDIILHSAKQTGLKIAQTTINKKTADHHDQPQKKPEAFSEIARKTIAKNAVKPEKKAAREDSQKNRPWIIRTGIITNSLAQSGRHANIPPNKIAEIQKIFGTQINFHRDIRKGDRFTIIFEKKPNTPLKKSNILAVEIVNQGKAIQAIRYASNGMAGYYSPAGHSMESGFLRNPVQGKSRISSHFSHGRMHPILKVRRPHRGTDFSARIGTPVIATAHGVVAKKERQRGYGNVIFLRHHSGEYMTVYAHLSRFARGLRVGKRVTQGQIIGYVGSTGLSSGPHLHYEFRKYGKQLNPMKVKLPRNQRLSTNERKQFLKVAASLQTQLQNSANDLRVASR